MAKLKPRSLYLDLALHLKTQEEGEPPFTPAVPLVAAVETFPVVAVAFQVAALRGAGESTPSRVRQIGQGI